MTNPFNDHGDDKASRGIEADSERLERERLHRERVDAEQSSLEEDAEFTHDGAEDGGDAHYLAAETEQLMLGDEDERLPWLESDDDYAEDVVDTGRIAVVAMIGLLAVLAIVGLAWWLSRDGSDAELLADGSTIEAPAEPFRARPENPGGLAAEGTGDVSYEVGEGQDRETQMATPTPRPTPTPTPTASASAAAAQPSIDREQADTAGGVGVQVGAYSSRATAETGWSQLANQHSALSGVSHRVVQAQVDGSTVYRLQAVAGTVADAETMCRAIKAGGGDCRVAN